MDTLNELRQRLKLAPSLTAVQKLSGVSYRQLLRIRAGEGSITLRTYAKVDKALSALRLEECECQNN